MTGDMNSRKKIHLYNLIYQGKDKDEAYDYVKNSSLEELEKENTFQPLMDELRTIFNHHILKGAFPPFLDFLLFEDEKCYVLGDRMVTNFDSEEELCYSLVLCLKDLYYFEGNPFIDNVNKVDFEEISYETFSVLVMVLSSLIDNSGYNIGRFNNNVFIPSSIIKYAYKKVTGRQI